MSKEVEEPKVHRIDHKAVRDALLALQAQVAGHLDLEGFAYIKITRTGPDTCFSSDKTSEVLKLEGCDYKEQERTFWQNPAMRKWWRA
jgi:hypothetical protein